MAALRPNAPSQDFMRVIGVVSIRYKSIHDTTRRQAARRGPLACMWLSAADSDDAETPPNRQRPVEKVRGQPGHPFVAVVRALQHLAVAHDRAAGSAQHGRATCRARVGPSGENLAVPVTLTHTTLDKEITQE